MIAYKVVEIDSQGELVSAIARGRAQVKYPLGKEARSLSDRAGLFCFLKRNHALNYLDRLSLSSYDDDGEYRRYAVLECLAKEPAPLPRWDSIPTKEVHYPQGTVTFMSLTPIRYLEIREEQAQRIPMTDQVIKIVHVEFDGRMLSIAAFGKAEVTYQLDVTSTPPEWIGTGLLAFSDLASAKEWLNEYFPWPTSNLAILICDGEDKVELPKFASVSDLAYGRKKYINSNYDIFPPGTVAYMKITPRAILMTEEDHDTGEDYNEDTL